MNYVNDCPRGVDNADIGHQVCGRISLPDSVKSVSCRCLGRDRCFIWACFCNDLLNGENMRKQKTLILALVLGSFVLLGNPAAADIPGGQAAILRGDFAQAFKEFKEDADKGIPHAQAAVAVMLHIGQGVKRDLPKALAWYRKAAEKGYEAGVANVGIMYYKGAGIPQNDVQAYAWLDLASHMRGGREHNAKARVAGYLSPKQRKEAEKLATSFRQKYLKK